MKKWLKKQWWMAPGGLLLTFFIGCFPQIFIAIGETLILLFTIYWSHTSTTIIISLLLVIIIILLKQHDQKKDSSAQ